jgi:hypothetical protein
MESGDGLGSAFAGPRSWNHLEPFPRTTIARSLLGSSRITGIGSSLVVSGTATGIPLPGSTPGMPWYVAGG